MVIVPSSTHRGIVVWLMWLVVCIAIVLMPGPMRQPIEWTADAVAVEQHGDGILPWVGRVMLWYGQTGWRWMCWQAGQWRQRILLMIQLWGCRSLAEVIQVLTRRRVVRYVGALPVLVAMLRRLRVQEIVDQYCPTRSPVKHGVIVLVLALNRLMGCSPLYKIVDWLVMSQLTQYLDTPAEKFNDDRLGRTLDAIFQHLPEIWSDIQRQALLQYKIDLSVLFYDLTALVMTGQYANSELVGYGFAHNTPMSDPKVKLGLVASYDGAMPVLFQSWPGPTADKTTVKSNLQALRRFLRQNGWHLSQVLLVGDCANLNSELALVYHDAHVRYLTSLAKLEKVHRELIEAPDDRQFDALPLVDGDAGVPCEVPFTHNGRMVYHQGLVVRSAELRRAQRKRRKQQLHKLLAALAQVKSKIGQKHYRTQKAVQQRIATQLKRSPVRDLVDVQVTATLEGSLSLTWCINADALHAAQHNDGRFLLVTNDRNLSYTQMLVLYRQKDKVEKRFTVCKQDLKIRPLRVHSDQRIQSLLLVNLIALLTYSLLERQVQQHGLCLTARRIIEKLSSFHIQEVEAWDGSRSLSCLDADPDLQALLFTLLSSLVEHPRTLICSGPLSQRLLPTGKSLSTTTHLPSTTSLAC